VNGKIWSRGYGGVWLTALLTGAVLAPAGAQTEGRQEQQQLAAADDTFGLKLLAELSREQPGANLFISPFSVSSVLHLLSDGARGQTGKELQQVLGTGDLDSSSINKSYRQIFQSLNGAQTNAVLTLANALWYKTGVEVEPDFVAANQNYYHTTLAAVDFSAPQTVQEMNDWASRNTQGKIQTMIQPPIPPDTAMVIANAIYFKGTWLNPFDPKQTLPRAFHSSAGDKQVPMMQQTRNFQYQESAEFQAVQMDYAGKQLQMQVLLPAANSSVATLLAGLNAGDWKGRILAGFRDRRGTVVLPRFRLEYRAELKPALTALGLRNVWGAGADFSGMSRGPLFLSEVKHQSFVEVNEQGTEAAAVTSGVMALAAIRQEAPPFEMVADRPFLFVITHRPTGAILFLGIIRAPTSG
jgi:serine protease inhibitor